ncbi:DNA cytosine methyltransferase [Mycolicibacterium sp.]|uniref:DNA cytosine methyltransferase n=1 Tax=Mycolicibacterium sp. TaxID=2320850 RepID=UPI00355F7747
MFSGAGGLDLAVEVAFSGRTVWHCEVDPAASIVLAHRWPDVPNLGDITKVDWAAVEPVDVLCGGFPCQDVSAAGRRAGIREGTRSGLWAVFADAIAALRPRYVVIENVRGLLSADGEPWPDEVVAADAEAQRLGRVVALLGHKRRKAIRKGYWHGEYRQRKQFEATWLARQRDRAVARFRSLRRRLVQRAIGTVVRDLADLGYDAQWTTVAASTVGAPHRRERVFILAEPADAPGGGWERVDGGSSGTAACRGRHRVSTGSAGRAPTPDTTSDGRHEGWPESAGQQRGSDAAVGGDGPVALLPTPSVADGMGGHLTRSGGRSDELLLPGIARAYGNGELLPTPNAQDGNGGGRFNSDGHQSTLPGTVRDLLPTPRTRDHKGGTASRGGDNKHDLPSALLPTPASADGDRGPDFARAGRDGSGGDDLVTLCARATQERGTQWGRYAAAVQRWEEVTGQPAPAPTEPNRNDNPRLAPEFPEWMMGWPAGWVTAVPGISRNDALRIIGNGVCPQQAHAALRFLLSVAVFEVAA